MSEREYNRGFNQANVDLMTRSAQELIKEWDRCNIGDDYDRGYYNALCQNDPDI